MTQLGTSHRWFALSAQSQICNGVSLRSWSGRVQSLVGVGIESQWRLRAVRAMVKNLLTPESQSGPTRLDLTCRLLQPKSAAGTAEAARSQMAESLKKVASDYKSLIEEAGRHA